MHPVGNAGQREPPWRLSQHIACEIFWWSLMDRIYRDLDCFALVDKFKAILNELEDHQNIAVELEDPLDPFPPKRRCCAASSLQSSPTAIPLTLESLRPERVLLGKCPEVGDNLDTCHLWKDEHPFAIYFDVKKVNWRVPELGGLTS